MIPRNITRTDFLEAIRIGDIAIVRQYLALNRDDSEAINFISPIHDRVNARFVTPLMIAIHCGQSQVVDALLDIPATDVNYGDTGACECALIMCITLNRPETFSRLLRDPRINLHPIGEMGREIPWYTQNYQLYNHFYLDNYWRALQMRARGQEITSQPSLPVVNLIISAEEFLHAAREGDMRVVQAYIATHP